MLKNRLFLLTIDDPIGPAAQDYIHHGLTEAAEQHAALIILKLNTPGGIDKSLRKILQDIIASPVPVVSYVAPSSARAASAGVFILYASNLAAMAPNTRIGPATLSTEHDSIRDTLTLPALKNKMINDSIKNLRSLAELHHRNGEWAEASIRNMTELSAEAALKGKVINVIAEDVPQLLQKINGLTVESNNIPIVLNTKDFKVETIPLTWRYHFISYLTNPVISYFLLFFGILGVFFESLKPGKIIPGAAGFICLVFAFYAFRFLPISYAGLTLLLTGMTCMIIEKVRARFGIAGACGIISFILGSMLLLDMNSPGYHLVWSTLFIISLASAGLFFIVTVFAIKNTR